MSLLVTSLVLSPAGMSAAAPPESPLDALPEHIVHLPSPDGVQAPERPQFAPNGRSLFFVDGATGDLWEYGLHPRPDQNRRPNATNLTTEFAPPVQRVAPLSNGDLVLCAPTDATGGRLDGKLWVMQRPLGERPPVLIGDPCWEGIAASKERDSTRILWNPFTFDWADPNQDMVNFPSQVWTGRIEYGPGRVPTLVDRELVVDRYDVSCGYALLESQDLRTVPGSKRRDSEVVFTAYGPNGFNVMGIDRESGQITDYSRSPLPNEAEGVAPNGEWEAVERNYPNVDIWRLSLDGDAVWEQLTFVAEQFPEWKANNPVVSPDLRWMAFTFGRIDAPSVGSGSALLLFDLKAWDESDQGEPMTEPDRLPPFTPPPPSC